MRVRIGKPTEDDVLCDGCVGRERFVKTEGVGDRELNDLSLSLSLSSGACGDVRERRREREGEKECGKTKKMCVIFLVRDDEE